MSSHYRLLTLLAAAGIGCSADRLTASTLLWSDDFSADAESNAPGRDFTGNGTPDYTFTAAGVNVVSTTGNPSNALHRNDTVTTTANNATVLMTQFSPFTLAAGQQLRVSYDFRVDSFSAGNTHNPRLVFRFSNAGNRQMVVGFGRSGSNIDADGSAADLSFYANVPTDANSLANPTAANAIGLSGGAWATGFDFGNHGAAGDNDTNDQFYRFDFTYDYDTGAVTGTVTNTVTGETTTFTRAMEANLAFSSEGGTSSLVFATGQDSMSEDYFDNIRVELIPEPSALALAGGGLLLGCLRRSRRK